MRPGERGRSSLAGGEQQRTGAGGGRRKSVAADYSLLLRLSFVFEDWLDSTGLDLDWTGNGALGCRMQGKARMVEEKL